MRRVLAFFRGRGAGAESNEEAEAKRVRLFGKKQRVTIAELVSPARSSLEKLTPLQRYLVDL